ncbi:MAG TPA: polyphenol oxidase family protein [Acidimicrobiales bacterium]|nr:polyphenol oxidase family protein [Acidimicrobiales bacterium]
MNRGPGAGPAGVLLGALVRYTGRADGDLRPAEPGGAARLREAAGRPVAWLRQVHGDHVVVADGDPLPAGEEGDALVTTRAGVALAVLTADCAPVALASPEGVVGAVHAGWAGLAAGVVGRAVEAMGALGASRVDASLGPCIHPECYEFGAADLDRVAARLGDAVRGTTAAGRPALDLPAAVETALRAAGAGLVADAGVCTACQPARYFSHRARGEAERQATFVWTAA